MSGESGVPLSRTSGLLSGMKAPGASTAKTSKFKPSVTSSTKNEQSRKTGLTSFSTPGFQPSKVPLSKAQRDVVDVSSDSSPSTPGLKRVSSDLSLLGEPSPHPSKRLRKAQFGEKENVLQTSSKVNMAEGRSALEVTPRHAIGDKEDLQLHSYPLETLKQFHHNGLALRNQLADDCLAYHSGDTTKDIFLLGILRQFISERLEKLDTRRKELEAHKIATTYPSYPSSAQPLANVSKPRALVSDAGKEDSVIIVDGPYYESQTRRQPTKPSAVTNNPDSDDEYWHLMDELPYEPPVASSSSSATPVDKALATSLKHDSPECSPYHSEISRNLKDVFKLTSFRTNQLAAITAAMEGRDVFVLMPTGGGKSLCYQLPAICTAGKTQGVTVVISPLVALMKDQVRGLTDKGIDALFSNTENFGEDRQRLLNSGTKPRMWYITPEKLRDSPTAQEILQQLYRTGYLVRFVTDEAHCISTWGQDFRDAYTGLGMLRDLYPSVPIMALTATANKRTVADIITQLKLRNDHAFFSQSFNRTNLKYIVQKKSGKAVALLNDIVTLLGTKYRGKAGVIYCHARRTCEKLAEELQKRSINAAFFHAGMSSIEKDQTAHDWQVGKTPVIIATVAFGMGIDKANVRFVIHHDIPGTISSYYQETGRAGRDGKPAECIMFFSVQDMTKRIQQIKGDEKCNQESKNRQINAVREVYQFCDNTSQCRRVQLLQHFDEKFDQEQCARGCDNCEEDRETVSTDVTRHAKAVLRAIEQVTLERGDKITKAQLNAVLRGSNTADVRARSHDTLTGFGSCKELDIALHELMMNHLEYLELFRFVAERNAVGYHNDYLVLGEDAQVFMQRREPFLVEWHPKPGKGSKPKKKAQGGESISAPPRSRKGKQKAVMDDPIETFDDMYDMGDETANSTMQIDNMPVRNHASLPKAHPISVSCVQATATTTIRTNITSGVEETGDMETTLYRKMLKLRDEIMAEQDLYDNEDVFDDSILQYISAICPTDYHAFKTALKTGLEDDVPDLDEFVDLKWNQYGQRFLRLCIEQKTRSSSTSNHVPQVHSPAVLHSRYDFKPQVAALASKGASTPTGSHRPKFKPS